MMQLLDSILPHQVECGVVWSKLLSTDPEIDIKEVILNVVSWNSILQTLMAMNLTYFKMIGRGSLI